MNSAFESCVFYLQLRCISICTDQKRNPTGFAVGSVEGRVAIQYLNPPQPKDNFTFKCHRVDQNTNVQDIYPVRPEISSFPLLCCTVYVPMLISSKFFDIIVTVLNEPAFFVIIT